VPDRRLTKSGEFMRWKIRVFLPTSRANGERDCADDPKTSQQPNLAAGLGARVWEKSA
jgi:hypothetical protein